MNNKTTKLIKKREIMARPMDDSSRVVKDMNVAEVDCRASSTLTGSLLRLNCIDAGEKMTINETEDSSGFVQQIQRGLQICYVRGSTWNNS